MVKNLNIWQFAWKKFFLLVLLIEYAVIGYFQYWAASTVSVGKIVVELQQIANSKMLLYFGWMIPIGIYIILFLKYKYRR